MMKKFEACRSQKIFPRKVFRTRDDFNLDPDSSFQVHADPMKKKLKNVALKNLCPQTRDLSLSDGKFSTFCVVRCVGTPGYETRSSESQLASGICPDPGPKLCPSTGTHIFPLTTSLVASPFCQLVSIGTQHFAAVKALRIQGLR